tara:strand:+ start:144 stop:371 length:228 start_codon:yes stop_codon:yes gene_type:complete
VEPEVTIKHHPQVKMVDPVAVLDTQAPEEVVQQVKETMVAIMLVEVQLLTMDKVVEAVKAQPELMVLVLPVETVV